MPRRAAFALRIAPILLWLVACGAAGLVLCLLRRGRGDSNREFARLFSRGVFALWGLRLEVEGLETLDENRPCVFVANHQSAMDMATFGGLYPGRTVVIAKRELKWIPLFGWFFAAAGNVLLDRRSRLKAVEGLSPAIAALRERGMSVWIFPEGTRNKGDGSALQPFKRGAFHIAVAAQAPLVPIVCEPLSRLVSWRERRMAGGTLRMRVLAPIPTAGMGPADLDRLSDLVRVRMQQALDGLSSGLTPAAAPDIVPSAAPVS